MTDTTTESTDDNNDAADGGDSVPQGESSPPTSPATGTEPSNEASSEAAEQQPLRFADFKVRSEIIEALEDKGITTPFPIQAETLPIALPGNDIIGQAKTGTGKTLGFGIPALQRVAEGESSEFPRALIVAPTRELAVQVAEDLKVAGSQLGVRIATIYGGRAYEPQIEELSRGVDVVVGTPGRLIDLHRQKHLNLNSVRMVVLDEADEMLDLGFLPDVEKLLSFVPEIRQTMLFSATMPGPVVSMARRYMSRPTHINAADPEDDGVTKKDIRQVVYRAHHLDKDEIIARVLQAEGRGRTIIFTRTKRQADKLSTELNSRGFAVGAIHGDLGQGAREQALRAFRSDKIDVLVATDVAARGIDVTDVTHVINLTIPEDDKNYLHRIGRTGRAGQKGTAVTFVDWEDVPRWSLIDKAIGLGIPEPIETYSSSPHLYEDLDIPAGTRGRLPRHQRKKSGLGSEEHEDLGGPGEKREGGGRGNGGRGKSHGGSGRNRNRRRRRSGQSGGQNQNQNAQNSQGEQKSGDQAQGGSAQNGQGNASGSGSGSGRNRRRRRRRRVTGDNADS